MSLSFTGYAAIWDRLDRAGDVMRRGAFAGAEHVPLLWQHRGQAVGRIATLAEDDTGLIRRQRQMCIRDRPHACRTGPLGRGGGTVGRLPAARRPSGGGSRDPVGRTSRNQPGDGADAAARPRESHFDQGGLIWT